MSRHKQFHHRINLRLNKDLYEDLLRLSKQKGCSIADLCRAILADGT